MTRPQAKAASCQLWSAIPVPACGDDDESTGTGVPGGTASTPQKVPPSGITAASPEKATPCLEKAGFAVTSTDALSPEDKSASVTAKLNLTRGQGSGTVTYFETEQQAFDASAPAYENPQPNSTVARRAQALYVFSGEGFESAGTAIIRCL
jgi:hypothetical protein